MSVVSSDFRVHRDVEGSRADPHSSQIGYSDDVGERRKEGSDGPGDPRQRDFETRSSTPRTAGGSTPDVSGRAATVVSVWVGKEFLGGRNGSGGESVVKNSPLKSTI